MAQAVAAKWKELTPDEKVIYEATASEDRVRYKKEVEVWNKAKKAKELAERREEFRIIRDQQRWETEAGEERQAMTLAQLEMPQMDMTASVGTTAVPADATSSAPPRDGTAMYQAMLQRLAARDAAAGIDLSADAVCSNQIDLAPGVKGNENGGSAALSNVNEGAGISGDGPAGGGGSGGELSDFAHGIEHL